LRGFSKLVKLIRQADSILIIGHQNSDPDAVCSAYAFSVLARRINHKVRSSFTSPGGVSKLSKQILAGSVQLVLEDNPPLSDFNLIVTVDTNTLQQLGNFRESVQQSSKCIVMIDHHAPHLENAKATMLVICEENATSTCEILLAMFKKMHIEPDRRVSQALLIGLLVETGHLAIGTRKTYAAAYDLIRTGADPEAALALTRQTMDESERIARVKSAQRLRLERINQWLIATSEVGSYHASAARGLIALGAHLAIVAGKRNDDLTVSFRCTREFAQQSGLHLGTDLASVVGRQMGGMGGGHPTAAGANVKGEANEAVKLAVRLIREFLANKPKPNTTTTTETNVVGSPQTQTAT
jgi:nanoRNase/pAp phosphatase (c-di-AMP/oligoRNAs hydrolase)